MGQRRRQADIKTLAPIGVTGSHTVGQGEICLISVANYVVTASVGSQPAGSRFGGIATEYVSNTGSAGAESIQLIYKGGVELPVTGTWTSAQLIGAPLYAVGANAVAPSGTLAAAAGYVNVGSGGGHNSDRTVVICEVGSRGVGNGTPV